MTVTLLALGLVVAGLGTAIFLRTTLVSSVSTQVEQLAPTDLASSFFDVVITTDGVIFADKDQVPSTSYFVAVYDSTGALRAHAGGTEGPGPAFPDEFTLESAAIQGTEPFTLPNSVSGPDFLASVDTFEGVNGFYVQMVAMPLAPPNQVVAQYIGIYSILAVIILIASAFATRWLVTLTFRSLGQVERTAEAIAAGDFSQRMTDIEPKSTEVGRLKTAINTMLGRVDFAISQRDASVRQMRRFIGDASHELRTPLVTVRGYAELYRMGAISGDDNIAQAMERIEKEAMRMGVLVEDLLALARLDERRDVVITPVDLRPIARDAALDVRATSPLRQVTVIDTTTLDPSPPPAASEQAPDPESDARRKGGPPTSAIARAGGGALSLLRRKPRPVPAVPAAGVGELPPPVTPANPAAVGGTMPPIVLGDENRIRQVVANLLGNARRFTTDASPIELRIGVDPSAGMGWIEVVDHGDGIPEQIRDKIFQRFWRADTSRARETGGSGLGLSIVASIVEALHGEVSVGETPGGGATFRVAFPLAQQRAAADHLLIETQPLTRLDLPQD